MNYAVYAVLDVKKNILWSTFGPSVAAAISRFEQENTMKWDNAAAAGYTVTVFSYGEALELPKVNVKWDLYPGPGSILLANQLNQQLSSLLAESCYRGYPASDYQKIEQSMLDLMCSYESYGSADSEPRAALKAFLDKTFRV